MCWMLDGSIAYSRRWMSTRPPSLLSSLQVGAGQLRHTLPPTPSIPLAPPLPPASCLHEKGWLSRRGSVEQRLGVLGLDGKRGGR